MQGRILAFAFLHLIGVCVIWHQVFVRLVPLSVSEVCVSALNYVACVEIAYFTFRIVKRKWIAGQVHPENKAVLITGCDTGFGHLLAERLDSSGFVVFAGCLFPAGPGAQQLQENCSPNLTIVELDVTNEKSIAKAVEVVRQKLGLINDLWAVVNNAGILKGFSTDWPEMKDFAECLDVNSLGTVRTTKAFLPLIKDCQEKGARIINVTSMGGRLPAPYMTPYIMSKFASTGFTECLRQELHAWGIHVIAIEPEGFLTPIADFKVASQHMDLILSRLDENLKEDYGNEYFESFKKAAEKFVNMASPNINRAVDALETAVSAECPDHTYKPSRHFVMEYCRDVLENIPITVRDSLLLVIGTCMRYPNPKRMRRQ